MKRTTKTATKTKVQRPVRRRSSTTPVVMERPAEPVVHAEPAPRARGAKCDARFGGCGRVFHSVTAFDAHRVGTFETRHKDGSVTPSTRRCLSDEELAARGFGSDAQTGVWSKLVSADDRARFAALHGGPKATPSPTQTDGDSD